MLVSLVVLYQIIFKMQIIYARHVIVTQNILFFFKKKINNKKINKEIK